MTPGEMPGAEISTERLMKWLGRWIADRAFLGFFSRLLISAFSPRLPVFGSLIIKMSKTINIATIQAGPFYGIDRKTVIIKAEFPELDAARETLAPSEREAPESEAGQEWLPLLERRLMEMRQARSAVAPHLQIITWRRLFISVAITPHS